MDISEALAIALKQIREARNMTQEDFVGTSGRTYISELERGVKSPSLAKLDALSERMGIHPLTLLLACYELKDGTKPSTLMVKALGELNSLV